MEQEQFSSEMEQRFNEYVEHLASTLKHEDRVEPFRAYCIGLLLPGERKSIEPIAARVSPERVSAAHQSLHHFVAKADWSAEQLLCAVESYVLPRMQSQEPLRAWIVDDTGMPKKGEHSVGVARQYCGQLGKQDNCQVVVSISLANHYASLPAAYRLFVPKKWFENDLKRRRAGIPSEIKFQTKSEIALDQLRALKDRNVSEGVVLADAAYGNDSKFRQGLRKLQLAYVVGIQKTTKVWRKGEGPLPPAPYGGTGRQARLLRPNPQSPAVSVLELAQRLSPSAYEIITWREGTNEDLCSRFARVRVREAHRYYLKSELPPEQWLLIEWPEGEAEPTKYWLSNLPEQVPFKDLVDWAKLRWRVDRDYQELKQEVGLGHFEGRGWRGFHHHGALCIAAYGFLAAERSAFPPSGAGGKPTFRSPPLPQDFRPRGSAGANRKAHPAFHRHFTKALDRGSGAKPLPVPVLSPTKRFSKNYETEFMTQ
jgi:SRSO17 transposase